MVGEAFIDGAYVPARSGQPLDKIRPEAGRLPARVASQSASKRGCCKAPLAPISRGSRHTQQVGVAGTITQGDTSHG